MNVDIPKLEQPLPVLREAFARAHIGRRKIFGDPNIADVVDLGEREPLPPPILESDSLLKTVSAYWATTEWSIHSVMQHCIMMDVERMYVVSAQHLSDDFRPFHSVLLSIPVGCGPRFLIPVRNSSDGYEYFLMYQPNAQPSLARFHSDERECRFVIPEDIPFELLRALESTWMMKGEQATEARTCLCRIVRAAIAYERLKAKKVFDEAVAVSPDGPKTLSADHVVVLTDTESLTGLLYEGSVFLGKPITLSERRASIRARSSSFDPKVVLSRKQTLKTLLGKGPVQSDIPHQILVRIRPPSPGGFQPRSQNPERRKIFITRREYLNHQPEGGEPIRL